MFDLIHQYRLTACQRFCYGVGHVLNDLCAILWCTYLLIYYTEVLGLSCVMAGWLFLLGQTVVAIATPIISLEAFRMASWCGYQKRKVSHICGVCCVVIGFALLFNPEMFLPPGYYSLSDDYKLSLAIYYAPSIVIYQLGWALCQVSYVAFIPSLTDDMGEKEQLNFIRHSFMVGAHMVVYAILWLLLAVRSTGTLQFPFEDYRVFQILVWTVLGIGASFTLIFHMGTKEVLRDHDELNWIALRSSRLIRNIVGWLKSPQFYCVGTLYIATRLMINILQVYIAFYITKTLRLPTVYIAIVPLVMCVTGFITTYPGRFLSLHLGKKVVYIIGLLSMAGSCVWLHLLDEGTASLIFQLLGATALVGIAESTLLMLSLTLTADLIQLDKESAAFVYGSMDVADKILSGISVFIIQIIYPHAPSREFYRYIVAVIPLVLSFISLLALPFVKSKKLAEAEKQSVYDTLHRSSKWTTYGTMKEEMFDHFSTTLTETVDGSYGMSSSLHLSRDLGSSNILTGQSDSLDDY
ncbi:major facilitator superfamily domain-containing protein 12-like [Watersipora subatra]|uniref:major facilitator superfamily domain-containing protein 12-like n=1 Tax=Watersipora subatra TaxID=2589382 RepID=UPI00355BEA65